MISLYSSSFTEHRKWIASGWFANSFSWSINASTCLYGIVVHPPQVASGMFVQISRLDQSSAYSAMECLDLAPYRPFNIGVCSSQTHQPLHQCHLVSIKDSSITVWLRSRFGIGKWLSGCHQAILGTSVHVQHVQQLRQIIQAFLLTVTDSLTPPGGSRPVHKSEMWWVHWCPVFAHPRPPTVFTIWTIQL